VECAFTTRDGHVADATLAVSQPAQVPVNAIGLAHALDHIDHCSFELVNL
jgi:hypothetical protein